MLVRHSIEKKLDTVSRKQIYEENRNFDEDANFLSQTALYRLVRISNRSEKDCFSIEPITSYGWRSPCILGDDLEAALYTDSMIEYAREGYLEERKVPSKRKKGSLIH